MADEQLLVTLGVQDKGATKQINALNKELKYLDQEFKVTSKTSKDFENTQEGLKSKLSLLENKFEVQKTKLEIYKSQLDKAKEGIVAKKEELDKLTNAEGDNAKAIEKVEKQLGSYQEQMINATRNMNLTEAELKNLKADIQTTNAAVNNFKIDQFKTKMDEMSLKMEATSEKFKNAGSKINGLGNKLTMGITVPVVTAGTAAIKLSADMVESINKVDTVFEKNSDNVKAWSETTLDSFGISKNASLEYVSLFGDMGKSMGLSSDQVRDYSKNLVGLAGDLASFKNISVERANTALSGIYTGETEALKSLGIVMTEANLEAYALEKGLIQVDKDSPKILKAESNLKKSKEDLKEAISKYGKESIQASKALATVKDNESKLEEAQKGKLDQLNQAEKVQLRYNYVLDKSKDAIGDYAKTSSTAGNQMRSFPQAMKELGATIGNDFLPTITPLIQKINQWVKEMAKMDEQSRASKLKMIGFAAAVGPVLKGVGGITTGIGGTIEVFGKMSKKVGEASEKLKGMEAGTSILSKGFKLLSPTTIAVTAAMAAVAGTIAIAKTNADLMGKTATYTTDDMSLLEKAVSKFNGTTFRSKKELIDAGLVYKDFSNKISPEFQDKVKQNTKKVNEFSLKLAEINLDGVISKEESAEFTKQVNEACDSAINAIKVRQEESNKRMKDLFISDGVINDSEKRVLDFLNKNSETQIEEVSKLKKEILDIESKALTDKRKLDDDEIKMIKEKRAKIAQIELEALGKNQEEIMYAKNDFLERVKGIDIKGASELLTEKAKIRDEENIKIAAGYNTQISIMKEGLKTATGEDKTALEEQIKNAENARDAKLKLNNDLYDSYLGIIREKNPSVLAEVNKFNGEELDEKDKQSQKILENLKGRYENLNSITESGNVLLMNKETGHYDALTVMVDEKTGEITGVYNRFTGTVGAYSDEIGKEVKNIGDEHKFTADTVIKALKGMENVTMDSSGNIVDANGNIVWSLQDVKYNADNTREGVLNLNGTPINIKADADGAINNLEEVNNKIDDIPGTKTVTIKAFFKAIGEGIKDFFGFAEGTNNAPPGPALVAEEGRELIVKNGRAMLTSNDGPQLYNFQGGEMVIDNDKTERILAGLQDGYFNSNTTKSKSLVKNIELFKNDYNLNNTSDKLDITSIAKTIAEATATAIIEGLRGVSLVGNAYLDSGEIVGKVSNEFAMVGKRSR